MSQSEPTQYIVRLKDNVDMERHIQRFNDQHNRDEQINHKVHHKWNPEFANAYVGKFFPNTRSTILLVLNSNQGTFTPAVLALLKDHEDVEYISENSVGVDDEIVNQKCAFRLR